MNKEDLMVTTYSMWSMFRNCRRQCKFRYFDNLVPLKKDNNLFFGSVIHECLEIWHGSYDPLGAGCSSDIFKRRASLVYNYINRTYINRSQDDNQKRDWHMATAMMRGYMENYPLEKFQVIALEKTFEGKIVNPKTNAFSKSFRLSGKIDGIVQQDGKYYLLEHKTASTIDAAYIERLWTDFQITLYAFYAREVLNIPVIGIIYNILGKVKLKQAEGETEQEFQERRAALIAKSKTGKSTAKRKMPETDEEFQMRLNQKYDDPEIFRREMIYLSQDRYVDLQQELWKLSQALLEAKRNDNFYRNTSQCFSFHRQCAYYPICSTNDNQNVIENYYEKIDPHQELIGKEEKTVSTELNF